MSHRNAAISCLLAAMFLFCVGFGLMWYPLGVIAAGGCCFGMACACYECAKEEATGEGE